MFVIRRVVTVLLISFLASGASAAPALRHSHAMSDDSPPPVKTAKHSHQSGHRHSHHHHHHHHHHGDAHRHESSSVLNEPAVEHLHVMWFGVGLAIPVSPDDPSPRTNSLGEWVPLVSALLPAEIVAADALGFDAGLVTARVFSMETPIRTQPFVPPKLTWLCDIARRERSGVLNI